MKCLEPMSNEMSQSDEPSKKDERSEMMESDEPSESDEHDLPSESHQSDERPPPHSMSAIRAAPNQEFHNHPATVEPDGEESPGYAIGEMTDYEYSTYIKAEFQII